MPLASEDMGWRMRGTPGFSPHVSQPAALVFVIAQRIRALLHFLSIGFATIEVEERIEVRPQAEPRAPKAIRFRSERFRRPKPALLDSLHLRDGACQVRTPRERPGRNPTF